MEVGGKSFKVLDFRTKEPTENISNLGLVREKSPTETPFMLVAAAVSELERAVNRNEHRCETDSFISSICLSCSTNITS